LQLNLAGFFFSLDEFLGFTMQLFFTAPTLSINPIGNCHDKLAYRNQQFVYLLMGVF